MSHTQGTLEGSLHKHESSCQEDLQGLGIPLVLPAVHSLQLAAGRPADMLLDHNHQVLHLLVAWQQQGHLLLEVDQGA